MIVVAVVVVVALVVAFLAQNTCQTTNRVEQQGERVQNLEWMFGLIVGCKEGKCRPRSCLLPCGLLYFYLVVVLVVVMYPLVRATVQCARCLSIVVV